MSSGIRTKPQKFSEQVKTAANRSVYSQLVIADDDTGKGYATSPSYAIT
jgi:hypothetical protein